MRLPEAGAAIDEEGVVRRPRGFGHGAPRRDREAVRGADHVAVERVLGVQDGGHAGAPAASFFSTSSEIPFSVSNTPTPCSASARKLVTPRKLRDRKSTRLNSSHVS